MDSYQKLLCVLLMLTSVVTGAPPTRKSSYGKPADHHREFHHKELHHKQQDEQAWFNGQVTEPPVEWPEEPEDVEEENHHHQQQQQAENEGSAGPWVGLAEPTSWPDKNKKVSWPSSYGNGNGKRNGKSRTTLAPSWPPKPIIPQGGWADPSQSDDSLWPDTPAVQLHKKFHGKALKQKGSNGDNGVPTPQVPSWSDAPAKAIPWPSKINGDPIKGNGKKNGHHHHHGANNKPAVLGWDQIPVGYAQKRPTWTKKKDHVIKFKESKFSQTDYTAPSDDAKNGEGGWVDEEEEEAGWQDEEPKSWAQLKKPNGHHHHHQPTPTKKQYPIKSNGAGGQRVWSNGAPQTWPRGAGAKNGKWTTAPDGEGPDSEIAGAGQHHHNGAAGSSLNNGWLDLQKELYLLKNKVRVSSSNGSWAPAKDGWKQQSWSNDQEPFSSATKMVTKVVFAESLPKGEKVVMRWTPPVSYQVTN